MLDTSFSLTGKTALVTGASSGLGAHFARVLASAGAQVVLAARRVDKLEANLQAIEDAGGKAVAVAMDVTSPENVSQAMEQIADQMGPLHVLINNAGVADSRRFVTVDEESWDLVVGTNLTGVWRVAREVTARMLADGVQGSIVNVASILGLRQGFGESSYATSKAGVVQLTKEMALELGPKGIRVNALCPGYVKTEINADYFASEKGQAYIKTTPAGRVGTLDELTAPLLLLASDAGSFINGIALPVDGGHLVSSL